MGTVLSDKYEVLELIGTGGMADVYKGKDIRLGRNVAIKVLKKEFNKDEDFITRFMTESKAIASLNHTSIVNVYDVGFDEELNYIVMELVTGNTLKDYLDNLPHDMKEESVINIAIQICSALSQAHSKNVVHRDIKAQNILIDVEGRIKVADFGIARRTTSRETIVKSEDVFGSVHYASPEQSRGLQVDRRSDIYSLGILMYELLTKTLPFDAPSAVEVAMMQVREPMPDPRDKNQKVSAGMAKIISIATHKKPSERYQDAVEMMNDLRRLKGNPKFIPIDRTITRDPDVVDELLDRDAVGTEPTEEPPSKLNYILSALVGIGLALLITVIVVFSVNSGRSGDTTVVMPNVVKEEVNVATKKLAEQGIYATVEEYRFSDDVPANHVISTSILSGESIKKGYTIKLVVSKGVEAVEVPKLTELPLNDALSLILKSGFEKGNVQQEHSELPKGYVIKQTPEAGEKRKGKTTIDLVVSLGEKSTGVYVPSLTGQTLASAYSALAQLGLEVNQVTREHSEEYEKDYVIYSSRRGEMVPVGTAIDLVVSLGKEKEEETTETTDETSSGEKTTETTNEDGEETTQPTNAATLTTKEFVVPIDTSKFEAETTVIRIELLNNGEKQIVYQAEHSTSEGSIINVPLKLEGVGSGRLLIRYGAFVGDEVEISFE